MISLEYRYISQGINYNPMIPIAQLADVVCMCSFGLLCFTIGGAGLNMTRNY